MAYRIKMHLNQGGLKITTELKNSRSDAKTGFRRQDLESH